MLLCRSLIRVERVVKFANSCPSRQFQRFDFFHGLSYNWKMNGAKSKHSPMDHKKRKSVTTVWRQVPSQSCSSDVKDAKVEKSHHLGDGDQSDAASELKEVQSSSITCQSSSQLAHDEAEAVAEPSSGSTLLENHDDGRIPEAESVLCTEKHSTSIQVGSLLHRFIKGKGGFMQEKIEGELGVKLIFPSSRMNETIIIEGISAENVARASERIQLIIDEAVKSPTLDYSHFVSLPLAIYPELVDKLVNFQNSILGINDPNVVQILDSESNGSSSDEGDGDRQLNEAPRVAVKLEAQEENEEVKLNISSISPKLSKSTTMEVKISSELGIDKSIFIKPKTFHLTVLMLKLWNKERVDAATKILQCVSPKVKNALEERPVSIRLKGLECMKGSLAKARVLYASVEEVGNEDRLMQACKVIIDAFVEGGLVLEKDAKQSLKLHATVMNARHRKRKKRTKKFDSFDARGIMKEYGSEDWGVYLIREAHLSQRFVFDENGYYRCCASIPFPDDSQPSS